MLLLLPQISVQRLVKILIMQQFKVTASALNLRSAPLVDDGNLIITLPQGQIVTKLEEAPDNKWWKIATRVAGQNLQGFVAHQFLSLFTTTSSTIFDLPEPSVGDRAASLTLWATFYNVHMAKNISGGNPLLDNNGNHLGPALTDKDWCQAAMEGTVRVIDDTGNTIGTYNYAETGSTLQVDCSAFFPSQSSSVIHGTNRVRFKVSEGEYGEGTAGFLLVPYRSIAVDPDMIEIGSVIYIPDARGKSIVLPSGESIIHDGYFFAADVGGVIQDSHIDVFLGIATASPFPFVQSRRDRTFSAFLIDNVQTTQILKASHKS